MKKIIENSNDIGLLLLRVGTGSLMMTHGYSKLIYLFSGNEISFPDPLGLGSTLTLALAVFAELFCALLIVIGFKVRYAAIPLAFTMFTAVFIVHFNDPFATKELASLYLVCTLAIIFLGSGKYSIDQILQRDLKK